MSLNGLYIRMGDGVSTTHINHLQIFKMFFSRVLRRT